MDRPTIPSPSPHCTAPLISASISWTPQPVMATGHNHELIAKALKGRREKIVIHSKSGSPRVPGCQRSAWRQHAGLPEADL